MTTLQHRIANTYTLYGILFGFCFPLMATPMEAWTSLGSVSPAALLAAQAQNPLLWIIDSAPLFLGFFARLAGKRQAKVQQLIAEQDQVIAEQTQDLRAALEQAREADKAKSTFLANLSSELSTPMRTIMDTIRTLNQMSLDGKQQDLVKVLQDQGNSLQVNLENILDFTRLEAHMLTLKSESFSLTDCIYSAFELTKTKAEEKAVSLNYVPENLDSDIIVGDETRLRQILVNLINRGLKLTKNGAITVSVTSQPVSAPELQRELTFTLVDTGLATPPAQLKRLFNHQSSSFATRRYGETALGLAISQNLCELMGGRIWAESIGKKSGNRYLFTICVPVHQECTQAPSNGATHRFAPDQKQSDEVKERPPSASLPQNA